MKRRTVVTLTGSQPEQLRHHLGRSGITHDQTVRADIKNINIGNQELVEQLVEGVVDGKKVRQIFFCDTEDVVIREHIKEGDGAALPDEVSVLGLKTKRFGAADLNNVLISSNGKIVVEADAESKLVYH